MKNKISVIDKDERNAYNNISWYLTGYKCFVKVSIFSKMYLNQTHKGL